MKYDVTIKPLDMVLYIKDFLKTYVIYLFQLNITPEQILSISQDNAEICLQLKTPIYDTHNLWDAYGELLRHPLLTRYVYDQNSFEYGILKLWYKIRKTQLYSALWKEINVLEKH